MGPNCSWDHKQSLFSKVLYLNVVNKHGTSIALGSDVEGGLVYFLNRQFSEYCLATESSHFCLNFSLSPGPFIYLLQILNVI